MTGIGGGLFSSSVTISLDSMPCAVCPANTEAACHDCVEYQYTTSIGTGHMICTSKNLSDYGLLQCVIVC